MFIAMTSRKRAVLLNLVSRLSLFCLLIFNHYTSLYIFSSSTTIYISLICLLLSLGEKDTYIGRVGRVGGAQMRETLERMSRFAKRHTKPPGLLSARGWFKTVSSLSFCTTLSKIPKKFTKKIKLVIKLVLQTDRGGISYHISLLEPDTTTSLFSYSLAVLCLLNSIFISIITCL